MIDDPTVVQDVLASLGCVGLWEADYTVERIRTKGQLSTLYGLTANQASRGVSLAELDRAFHPDDVDMVRRLRKSSSPMKGGQHVVQFRIVDADGVTRWMEGHRHVVVDRFGLLTLTKGLVFETMPHNEMTPLVTDGSPSLAGLDQLTANLLQVCREARELGLPDVAVELKPTLTKMVRMLGRRFRQARLH